MTDGDAEAGAVDRTGSTPAGESAEGTGEDWEHQSAARANRVVQVQTTLGSIGQAQAMARAAVEARVAACGQVVGPVQSVYRWHGAVESTEEWLVIFKTTVAATGALQAFIRDVHGYETPELIALPVIDGSHEYLAWVEAEVDAGAT